MSINDVWASQCSFVSRGVMTRVKRKRDLPTETKVWQKVLAEAIYSPSWTPEYWTWQPQGLLNIGKQGVEKFKFNWRCRPLCNDSVIKIIQLKLSCQNYFTAKLSSEAVLLGWAASLSRARVQVFCKIADILSPISEYLSVKRSAERPVSPLCVMWGVCYDHLSALLWQSAPGTGPGSALQSAANTRVSQLFPDPRRVNMVLHQW